MPTITPYTAINTLLARLSLRGDSTLPCAGRQQLNHQHGPHTRSVAWDLRPELVTPNHNGSAMNTPLALPARVIPPRSTTCPLSPGCAVGHRRCPGGNGSGTSPHFSFPSPSHLVRTCLTPFLSSRFQFRQCRFKSRVGAMRSLQPTRQAIRVFTTFPAIGAIFNISARECCQTLHTETCPCI
jgi:hypothetical protein